MGAFSAAMLTELSKRQGAELVTVIEATLPDGIRNWSNAPISVVGYGPYRSRILAMQEIPYSVSIVGNSMGRMSTGAQIVDPDYDFAKAAARHPERMRGSVVVVKMGAVGVARASWYTAFTGVLDFWAQAGPGMYDLGFIIEDLPLRADIPRRKITQASFPNAHSDALNKYEQVVIGINDSTNVTGQGAVEGLYLDTVNFRYFFSRGYLSSFRRVYKDGVAITNSGATAWTVENPLIDGRRWTVLTFAQDQGEAAITADVEGLTDDGTGGGTLVTDPAAALKLLLDNFVLADWKDGAWLSTASLINASSFTAADTFLTLRGHEASYVLREKTTGLTVLQQWADTFEVKPHWDESGKISLAIVDPGEDFDSPVSWARPEDSRAVPLERPVTTQLANRVVADYLWMEVDADFKFNAFAQDYSLEGRVDGQSSISQRWLASRAT